MKRLLALIVCMLFAAAPAAVLAAANLSSEDIAATLSSAERSDSDAVRDAGRKPSEVLAFAGVQSGDVVLDLMAGSGYYTEIFSIVVGSEGKVYAQNPDWMLQFMKGVVDKAITERLADNRLANVQRVDGALETSGIPEGSVDIAFTALNFHDVYYDYGEAVTLELLAEVARLLKPEGKMLLIDHNGAEGVGDETLAKLHRMPEALMKQLIAKSDLKIVAESDLLANPEDDLTQMVFAKGLRGATDRYVLLLQK